MVGVNDAASLGEGMGRRVLPRDSFSASGTFSKPKWVVRASCFVCCCWAGRFVQERHL